MPTGFCRAWEATPISGWREVPAGYRRIPTGHGRRARWQSSGPSGSTALFTRRRAGSRRASGDQMGGLHWKLRGSEIDRAPLRGAYPLPSYWWRTATRIGSRADTGSTAYGARAANFYEYERTGEHFRTPPSTRAVYEQRQDGSGARLDAQTTASLVPVHQY